VTQALYLGATPGGWAWAPAQAHVLVLGPPRSGKTSSLVIPNVLAAGGPVVSTSTKPDVLGATLDRRRQSGECWLFDPTGEVEVPAGVTALRWSPIPASARWETARLVARRLVATSATGRGTADADHWRGRAEALLAPLLHAGGISGASMEDVSRWVNRRQVSPAEGVLGEQGSPLAGDVLAGVTDCEDRELSAIFSTAAQAISAYQSDAALATTHQPNFRPEAFVGSRDTVYVCAPASSQELVGPLVVSLLEEVCSAAYRAAGEGGPVPPAVVLALDEVANIAPLPSLPRIVSEGGGQGVLVLACFQDLSQAQDRWGAAAAGGFLSHFRAKLLLPGLGETRTLGALSALCGEVDVPIRSVSRSGHWWQRGGVASSTTWTTRRQPRLPIAALSQGDTGRAVYLEAGRPPTSVRLTPSHVSPLWRDLVDGLDGREPGAREAGRERRGRDGLGLSR
jgi:type IV secretion system protein VirD4